MAKESEITPELVEADDEGLYGKLRLFYYWDIGNQFLPDRDRRKAEQLTEQAGNAFTPDINTTLMGAKVKTLKLLNMEQFLNPDTEHTQDSLKKWRANCLRNKKAIKTFLGVTVTEKMGAIQIAQALLATFGQKLQSHQRQNKGKRKRLYGLGAHPLGELPGTFMVRWLERDCLVHTPSVNINNKRGVA